MDIYLFVWPAADVRIYSTDKLYTGNLSRFTALFWIGYIGVLTFQEALLSYVNWYLGDWASQYQDHDPSTVSASQ